MSTESVELQRVRGRQLLLLHLPLGLSFLFFAVSFMKALLRVPMGAGLGSWLQGAVSLRFGGSYPMVRWPLYGFCVAVVDFFLPTPLHISAQLLSMASIAGAAAESIGFWGGCSWVGFGQRLGWFFCLTFPLNMSFAEWCSSYALWGCACVWTVISMFEYHQSKQLKWAFGMGVGAAFSLAIMAKGLALGTFFVCFPLVFSH